MGDLSRRDFLQTAAGTTFAGALTGRESFLSAATRPNVSESSPEILHAGTPPASMIFPKPQEVSPSDSDFLLDDQVRVLIPSDATEQDLLLSTFLVHEVSDRYGVYLKSERGAAVRPGTRAILIGSIHSSLVRRYCSEQQLTSTVSALRPEGYILRSDKDQVIVAGRDDRGAFYGLQSLRQLITRDERGVFISGAHVRDWPDKPFRGITLYLPGRDQIAFFKRFVRDFVALYKFNTVIMEMNACMRLDSHPELNHGWIQFARDVNYAGRNYPLGPFHEIEQNSSHQDCGGGSFLEKEEVADLARWLRRHHVELIPQIPSFTHSYYLLTEHRELAAVPQSKWPDIYCPSNEKSYSLIFEVYDEYIDVLKPRMIHIGHDELFLPVGASPQCEDMEIGELYGNDVRKIHDHLASRGIRTALWGDMFLPQVRGTGLQKKKSADGWEYEVPGAMTREQVDRLVPKDCLVFNWFWAAEGGDTSAERNESYLEEMGFQQIYGNFEPTIEHYETRRRRSTLLGGAPSAWFETSEYGFGKDVISLFLGCSAILWTGDVPARKDLAHRVQGMIPGIRSRLSGMTSPSQTEREMVPVSISGNFNVGGAIPSFGIDFDAMTAEPVSCGRVPFHLARKGKLRGIVVGTEGKQTSPFPRSVDRIAVGESPTSVVFLHACGRRALNRDSFRLLWDQEDTADLLGWYEIVYQDGFTTTIPIRYGVNILEWNWSGSASANNYCYGADPVAVGAETKDSMTFFAYEWINPRLGKVIQEIRLRGTTGFQGGSEDFSNDVGPVIESNAVLLAALSVVRMRR